MPHPPSRGASLRRDCHRRRTEERRTFQKKMAASRDGHDAGPTSLQGSSACGWLHWLLGGRGFFAGLLVDALHREANLAALIKAHDLHINLAAFLQNL